MNKNFERPILKAILVSCVMAMFPPLCWQPPVLGFVDNPPSQCTDVARWRFSLPGGYRWVLADITNGGIDSNRQFDEQLLIIEVLSVFFITAVVLLARLCRDALRHDKPQ